MTKLQDEILSHTNFMFASRPTLAGVEEWIMGLSSGAEQVAAFTSYYMAVNTLAALARAELEAEASEEQADA